MQQFTIKYEGLEITVFGTHEQPESCTGYKGGWSTDLIKVNEVDISWMLNDKTKERINELVIELL
jgi:hypothetical protein